MAKFLTHSEFEITKILMHIYKLFPSHNIIIFSLYPQSSHLTPMNTLVSQKTLIPVYSATYNHINDTVT